MDIVDYAMMTIRQRASVRTTQYSMASNRRPEKIAWLNEHRKEWDGKCLGPESMMALVKRMQANGLYSQHYDLRDAVKSIRILMEEIAS